MGVVIAFDKTTQDDIISILEDSLAQARAGQVKSILLLQYSDNSASHYTAGLRSRFETIGYLTHLAAKLSCSDLED